MPLLLCLIKYFFLVYEIATVLMSDCQRYKQ